MPSCRRYRVTHHLGVECCTPGVAITHEQLDACAVSEFWSAGAPGLGMEAASWIHEKETAAPAVDNVAVEVEQDPDSPVYPLHVRVIRDLGLTLGEVWWLVDHAAMCAGEPVRVLPRRVPAQRHRPPHPTSGS